MDANKPTTIIAQAAQRSLPMQCPHCGDRIERARIEVLVAELLYKNQKLRFDLLNVQQQLSRVKSIQAEAQHAP